MKSHPNSYASSFVTSSKLLALFESQFSHLENGTLFCDTYLTETLAGFNGDNAISSNHLEIHNEPGMRLAQSCRLPLIPHYGLLSEPFLPSSSHR